VVVGMDVKRDDGKSTASPLTGGSMARVSEDVQPDIESKKGEAEQEENPMLEKDLLTGMRGEQESQATKEDSRRKDVCQVAQLRMEDSVTI
jgi:hypothetical protein